jgi:hypothetical protein
MFIVKTGKELKFLTDNAKFYAASKSKSEITNPDNGFANGNQHTYCYATPTQYVYIWEVSIPDDAIVKYHDFDLAKTTQNLEAEPLCFKSDKYDVKSVMLYSEWVNQQSEETILKYIENGSVNIILYLNNLTQSIKTAAITRHAYLLEKIDNPSVEDFEAFINGVEHTYEFWPCVVYYFSKFNEISAKKADSHIKYGLIGIKTLKNPPQRLIDLIKKKSDNGTRFVHYGRSWSDVAHY